MAEIAELKQHFTCNHWPGCSLQEIQSLHEFRFSAGRDRDFGTIGHYNRAAVSLFIHPDVIQVNDMRLMYQAKVITLHQVNKFFERFLKICSASRMARGG